MGKKKYIIELKEGKQFFVLSDMGMISVGSPEALFEEKNEDMLRPLGIIRAQPYTEPDTEQVRIEAYREGYEDAENKYCTYDKCANRQRDYQNGLNDAWECARKITAEYDEGGLSISDLYKVFGTESAQTILRDNAVQEAIAKIAEYEQEKKQGEKIKTGDVVQHKNKPDIKMWVIYADKFDDQMITGVAIENISGCCKIGEAYINRDAKDWKKTGEHYDVAAVLKKIKGAE